MNHSGTEGLRDEADDSAGVVISNRPSLLVWL